MEINVFANANPIQYRVSQAQNISDILRTQEIEQNKVTITGFCA